MLLIYFNKSIPRVYDEAMLKEPHLAIKDVNMFKLSWFVLAILMIGYFSSEFIGVPVSLVAGMIAIFFLMMTRRSTAVDTKMVIKGAPWTIVFFSIGMYIVLYGLGNAGLTSMLARVIEWTAEQGLFVATVGMGLLAAFLSSVMNNRPTVMVNALAIAENSTDGAMREGLIYANVIGSDLGPKIISIGSLAILVWLYVLVGKGVKISWGTYFKTGIFLTIPILLFTT